MIHDKIQAALNQSGVPVAFHEYEGESSTYITYFQYGEPPGQFADDKEVSANHYFQINIFSKGDYRNLEKEVTNIVTEELGGTRQNATEFKKDGWYQRSIRYKFNIIN